MSVFFTTTFTAVLLADVVGDVEDIDDDDDQEQGAMYDI